MRMRQALIAFCFPLIAMSAHAQTSRPRVDPALYEAVVNLAASDAEARQEAEAKLIQAGRVARPLLVRVMESDDPQLKSAAGGLILRLPFDEPTDPEAVRPLLSRYGSATPAVRISYLKTFTDVAGDAGPGILLRLIREEPTDEVRWAILGHLRATFKKPPLPEQVAMVSRAPNLALAGWAREKFDYPAAMKIYRRCIDLETDQPTQDHGNADFVFETLFNIYVFDKKYDDAAQVYRIQFARKPESIDKPEGVTNRLDELFAFHSRYGPLAGFQKDVINNATVLARPQIVYALGRLYERRAQLPLVADAIYRSAWALGAGDAEGRSAVSEFLTNQNWDGLARAELEVILAIETKANAANGPVKNTVATVHICNAHLRLGLIAARTGDDAAAAENKRMALTTLGAINGSLTRVRGERKFYGKEAEDLIWAEVYWHLFRVAKAGNNTGAMAEHAGQVISYLPDDEQIALDVLPYLVEQKRTADAEKLLAKPYAASKAKLADKPEDPERLNNLAWLCARAGLKLDEAQACAEKATKAKPDNYAYLDTLAEVHFQRGDAAKAIEVEKQALKLKPDDMFLLEQIKKFEAKAGR